MNRVRFIAALTLGLSALSMSALGAPVADWVSIDDVIDGDIRVFVHPRGEDRRQQRAVSAAIFIEAAPVDLWDIMVDCEQATEFVPGLRRCSVLEYSSEGYGELIEHDVKMAWFAPRVTYQFKANYSPFEKIEFQRIGGDLKEMEGSWTLMEMPDGGTLVIYDVRLDPGFMVPKWMVRRSLKRSLPKVLRALRDRATTPS